MSSPASSEVPPVVHSPPPGSPEGMRGSSELKPAFCECCDCGEPLQLPLIDVANRNPQTVNLGQRDFTAAKRVSNALALIVEPIRALSISRQDFLDISRRAARGDAITGGGSLHQQPIRAEHRAVRVNANPSVGGAARVQPPHHHKHNHPPLDNEAFIEHIENKMSRGEPGKAKLRCRFRRSDQPLAPPVPPDKSAQ